MKTVIAPPATVCHEGHRWVVVAETLTAQVLRRPRVAANPSLGYVHTTRIKEPAGRPRPLAS